MTQRVILFVFAGRRGNMELQVPMVERILAEHPNVEYHVWNLTGNEVDDAFVRGIGGERVTVFDNPHHAGGPQAFKGVYRHYGQPEYGDCLFVKLDDDIVFLETARFGVFLAAIGAHPGVVVSANVVNNGACCPLEPALWAGFQELGVPLVDVHWENGYAEFAHTWFFEHCVDMLGQPVELFPTEDWLSINCVGYDWSVACEMAARLGTVPHPAFIAGRKFPALWGLMDEALVNTLPRIIVRGFVAAHLSFRPQHCTEAQCGVWRERYREVGRRYLCAESCQSDAGGYTLPGLSAVLRAQEPSSLCLGWGTAGQVGVDNDPCAGRFTA